MKEVKAVKTLAEKRLAFVDHEMYADKYIGGTYDLISELYSMKLAPKFELRKIFDTHRYLTLKEDIAIRCYYGIGRPKLSIEELAKKLETSIETTKGILTNGKKRFMAYMAA